MGLMSMWDAFSLFFRKKTVGDVLFLAKQYLECSRVLLNLGDVDHLELMNKKSAAMRWVKLVCDLVHPSDGAGEKSSSAATVEGVR